MLNIDEIKDKIEMICDEYKEKYKKNRKHRVGLFHFSVINI